ncbi:GNAT family N-acetyltransferase [Paenibacillus urinalis]|uniref:GNAT family N-acetyltransferase n=1 Tax=Paenibacillus urinalis TaxID=521520 RepID=UPI00195F8737
MNIRQLRANEFELSSKLSEYAFRYTLTEEEKEIQRQQYNPEQHWGLFEENELQAKFALYPFQVYLHGTIMEMGGIASVSTWPEHRRKGHVAALLKHALLEMKNQGQTISFLHPFSVPFYRKYGWEVYAEYKKYEIEAHQLPERSEVQGKIVRDAADASVLDPIYQTFASRYNGTLVRDELWWERKILKKGIHAAVYYSVEGEAQGYVLYENKPKELICKEFVYLNEEARTALWSYLASHPADWFKLNMVPADDLLPFLLPEPRIKQELVPYFMARIVDFKPFIEQYTFKAGAKTELVLQLSDQIAVWNEGVWKLSIYEGGKGILERLPQDASVAPDIIGDIQTFTAMLMGYKRPEELYLMKRLAGNPMKVTQLEHALPARQTFFMDFF